MAEQKWEFEPEQNWAFETEEGALDVPGGVAKSLYDLFIATPLAGGMAAPQYPAIIWNKFFGTGEDISELGAQAFENAYEQVSSGAIDKAFGRQPNPLEQKSSEFVPKVLEEATSVGRGLTTPAYKALTGDYMQEFRERVTQPEKHPLRSTLQDFFIQGLLLSPLGRGGKPVEQIKAQRERLESNLQDPNLDIDTRLTVEQAIRGLKQAEEEAQAQLRAQDEAKIWGEQPREEPHIQGAPRDLTYELPTGEKYTQKAEPRPTQGILDLSTPFTTAEDIAGLRAMQQGQLDLFSTPKVLRSQRQEPTPQVFRPQRQEPPSVLSPIDDIPPSKHLAPLSVIEGAKNNISTLLSEIERTTTSPWYKEYAHYLNKLNLKDVGIEIAAPKGWSPGMKPYSEYRLADNIISLHPEHQNEYILLHEATHAVTSNLIHEYLVDSRRMDTKVRDALDRLNTFKAWVETTLPEKGIEGRDVYGAKNLQEYTAEAMTNPYFQGLLKETEIPRSLLRDLGMSGKSYIRNLWDAFVDLIRRALGMPDKMHDTLSLTMDAMKDVLKASTPEIRNRYVDQSVQSPPIDMIDPFGGRSTGKPVSPPPKEKKLGGPLVKSITGEHLFDRRTAQELVEELDPSKLQDIPLVASASKDFLQGYSVAAMARHNPIVRWMIDQFKDIDRRQRVAAEQAKYGTTYSEGWQHRFERHRTDYTGATTYLRRHHKDKEATKVHEFILKLDAEKREPTPEELATFKPRERQTIEAIRRTLKKEVDDHNKLAERAGPDSFARIEELPGYFPHTRLGDYMVFVEMNGETARAFGAKNAHEARTIQRDLQKQFPEARVWHNKRQSKFDMNDVSAFTEARKLLEKGSKEYKLIDDAFRHILAHRGFQKHTLHRKGIAGFLGEANPLDMAKALDLYIDRHRQFLANQEKNISMRDLYQSLKDKGIELPPRTKEFVEVYHQHSVGAMDSQMKLIDSFFDGIGNITGQVGVGSESLARDTLSNLSGTASLLWLTTPKFLIGNMFQPLFNLAKMKQLEIKLDTKTSPVYEFFRSYKNTVLPDKYHKEAVNYARRNGYIDSRLQELMGMDANAAKAYITAARNFGRRSLGTIETETVRIPAFLMYDSLLRNSVKDKETRWQMAGELVNQYMVDYTHSERPMIYEKLGLVGQAAAPLKTYSHSYFGNALEYLQSIKHEKSATPFAYFLGAQAFMSGVKGFILVQEANAIISALNYITGSEIPFVEEALINSDTGDTAVFGGISTLTGIDFSGSLSAPAGKSLISAPGVEFGYNLITSLSNLLIKGAKGTQTDADYMMALQSISHPLWVAVVEQAFTKPGQGPPNPRNKMIPDIDERTEADKFARFPMGGFSVPEAKQKLQIRQYKLDEAAAVKKRSQTFDAIIYNIEQGENPSELVQEYIRLGGNARVMSNNIIQRLIDKNMSFAKRELLKLPKADRLQRLERFNLLMQEMTVEELGEVSRRFQEKGGQQ